MQEVLLGLLLYFVGCIILYSPPQRGVASTKSEGGVAILVPPQSYNEVESDIQFLEFGDLVKCTGKKLKEYAREARVKKYGSSTKGELLTALLNC